MKKFEIENPDFDKYGLFQQQGYLHATQSEMVNKKGSIWGYDNSWPFRKGINKKDPTRGLPTLLGVGGPLQRNAPKHLNGYFMETYPSRFLEGEVLNNSRKLYFQKKWAIEKEKKYSTWVPSSTPKKSTGPGSFYGAFTFTPREGQFTYPEAVSRLKKDVPKPPPESKNVITNPGKKGTGYGYLDVAIGTRPFYKVIDVNTKAVIGESRYPQNLPDNYTSPLLMRRADRDDHVERSNKVHSTAFRLTGTSIEYFTPNPHKYVDKNGQELPPIPYLKDKTPKAVPPKPFIPPERGKTFSGRSKDVFTFGGYPAYKEEGPTEKKPRAAASKPFGFSGPKSLRQESIISKNVKKSISSKNYMTKRNIVYTPAEV